MDDKPIRRTQAIAPFGPGAIVDFPGPISLMHAGLDVYPFDPNNREHDEFKISDEIRLSKRVRADFFVEPMDYRKSRPGIEYRNPNLKLPFVKFPLWHVCPRCGRMYKSAYHISDYPSCTGPIGSGTEVNKSHRKRRCYQVRFLTVCTQGHISDFPWERWIFDGASNPSNPKNSDWLKNFRLGDEHYWLRYRASGSAAASGIEIRAERLFDGKIELIQKKILGHVFSAPEGNSDGNSGKLDQKLSPLGQLSFPITCEGSNPVLGIGSLIKPAKGCGSQLYVSLKNATNLYFPSVYSSIFIPMLDDPGTPVEVKEILENFAALKQLQTIALNNQDGGLVTLRAAKQVIRDYYPQYTNDETASSLMNAANRPKILKCFLEMEPVIKDKISKIEEVGGTPDLADYTRWLSEIDWELDPSLLATPGIGSEKREVEVQDEEFQEELFRHEEYAIFIKETFVGMPKTHLHVEPQSISSYPSWMGTYFRKISLLPKLRETRVFTGFNRISSMNLELEQRKSLFRENPSIKWLPGTVVRGEGLFVEFSPESLDAWYLANQVLLEEKESYLYRAKVKLKRQDPTLVTSVNAEMVLLHSFAHILINQLIYDSGYGSASLRERIYCSRRTPNRMSGVLIYTAAGDTEGSMGGLVRLGENDSLPNIIEEALIRASWCSSDPVCGESKGQGLFGGNLAACHACTLLPETSCEHMNLFLDRSMLVGTPEKPEIGFFRDLLDN